MTTGGKGQAPAALPRDPDPGGDPGPGPADLPMPAGHRSGRLGIEAFWLWTALGLVASVGLALTGTGEGSVPDPGHALWWFSIAGKSSVALGSLFYLSIGLLLAAWFGLWRYASSGPLNMKRYWLVFGLWGLPLALGPPLFSRDLYSYVSQGLIAHSGRNPYAVGPSVLGSGHLLGSVAAAWRHTPAPYGPLFVTASRWVAAVFGSSLTGEILAQRALELVGVGLLMWSLPRLARSLGTDPGPALWIGVLSPLALFSFVASGHNDALMLGLLVAGLALVMERKLVAGLVLCGLASTIKLPAALAVVFIAVAQLREQTGSNRLGVVAKVALVPAVVVVAVTWACGLGWSWLGLSALRVPAESRVLPTPSVALGTLAFHVLHLVHVHVGQTGAIKATQGACGLVAVLVTVWLAAKVRTADLVRLLGLAFVVIVLAGPAVWPWYLLWGVVLLAVSTVPPSKALVVAAAVGMLMVGPSGSPVLLGDGYIVVVLACAAVGWWLVARRRRIAPSPGGAVRTIG